MLLRGSSFKGGVLSPMVPRRCTALPPSCIADTRGVFVQPALFEAFGLTVVEAMTTSLPTFATNRGGPSEIIKHGRSGFQVGGVGVHTSCTGGAGSRWEVWGFIPPVREERVPSR